MDQAHYPDLTAPPGWKGVRMPPQIRLLPPGTTLDTAKATIIVSPIASRRPPMPSPEALIDQAIEFESRRGFAVQSRGEAVPAPSDHGLTGIAVDVTARDGVGAAEQRRIYAIYSDAQFYYGVSFMAFGEAYNEHLDTFWQVARSIRPFVGRAVPPPGVPAPVE